MDGPLDRRAAYGRLAGITNSYASIQTLIDEKIEAMETAGLLEPGAFTPKVRVFRARAVAPSQRFDAPRDALCTRTARAFAPWRVR